MSGQVDRRSVSVRAINLLDGADYVRDQVDGDRVAEFVELYAAAPVDVEPLPPLWVVEDGDGELFLAAGRHRLEAAYEVGRERVVADVHHPAGDEDVIAAAHRLAVESDARAAKPLTRAEKRRAVDRLLADYPAATDHRIADMAGVSSQMVERRRAGEAPDQVESEEEANGNGHDRQAKVGTSAGVIPLALHDLCFDYEAGRLRRDPVTMGRELAAGVRTYWSDLDDDQQRRGIELIAKVLGATATELGTAG